MILAKINRNIGFTMYTKPLPSLTGLVEDPGVGTTDDARMLAAYLRDNHALPPLPMAIGDPYLLGGALPAKLAAYERNAPKYLGGYSRTPAGIPVARRLIAEATIRRQELDPSGLGTHFDLHVTSGTGTRGIMGDFGHYLLDKQSVEEHRTPVVLCAAPTWDYAGVFEPMGYKMVFYPLRPENSWLPDVADIDQAIEAIDNSPDQRLALVVVNAQHNPTGRSWAEYVLQHLFEAATSHEAGILLDDPYNFVVTDRVARVSAPVVLLDHFARQKKPITEQRSWCRVESFGKAFSCNDWGIGTVMGHPEVLNELAAYTFRWAFPRAGKRQWAMAQWLSDPACDKFLHRQSVALRRKRTLWAMTLRGLGWPEELTAIGETTPYFLIAVPPAYLTRPGGIGQWRQDVMADTGILLSYASIEQEDTAADIPFLRAYLGGDEKIVAEAARRFKDAGIEYHQTVPVRPATSPSALGKKATRE